MGPRMRQPSAFSRRAQDRLDERVATGYEKASRQAAGGVEKQHPQTILDGLPMAKEKMIAAPAAAEAFKAQNKVPSCLPKAMPAAGASSPSVLNARFYPCILASAQSLNFSVLFG